MYHKQIAKTTSPSFSSQPINQQTIPTPSYGSLSGTIQRAVANPESLSQGETLELHSAIGTRATNEIISGQRTSYVPKFQGISAQLKGDSGQVSKPIQRQEEDNVNQSEAQSENQTPSMPEFQGISAQLKSNLGANETLIQAKLTIGAVGDKYEKEADRVASAVVQQINRPVSLSNTQSKVVQSKENKEEESELQLKPMVQRRADAGGEVATDLASAINSARGSGQPLDTGLQKSMGQAIGANFSGVRVHTDTKSDRLNQSIQAKAFTTGQDVFFKKGEYQPQSRGGQELIAHELTHVVQQNGGAVQRKSETPQPSSPNPSPKTQSTTETIHVNQALNNKTVVQCVRGGIEYTEDGPTMLYGYQKPFFRNVDAYNNFTVMNVPMTGFRVGDGVGDVPNDNLGARTNDDMDVLRTSPNVRLTNDVTSAEWIIERHQNDVSADTMRRNLKDDVNHMFRARNALKNEVNRVGRGHRGEAAIANGTLANTDDTPQAFIYKPRANKGKAQITAQYSNEDTIRRINELNVSKYLTGTKVAEGEDIPRITGNTSPDLGMADLAGTTSFSNAGTLLASIRGNSHAIPRTVGPGERLTFYQVGLIKLMVLNDALAKTMERYQVSVGQAQHKNIQRFFPKSRRDEYVKTIAQANLDATEMNLLQNEIQRTSAADAKRFFDKADAGALNTSEAFAELGLIPTMRRMIDARQKLLDPSLGTPHPMDVQNIKTAVLGNQGFLLAQQINQVAEAYVDLGPAPYGNHYFYDPTKPTHKQTRQDEINYGYANGGTVSKVIATSRGFTPVAGGGHGAIYEMREREIEIDRSGMFNAHSLDELNNAIDMIFGAVD